MPAFLNQLWETSSKAERGRARQVLKGEERQLGIGEREKRDHAIHMILIVLQCGSKKSFTSFTCYIAGIY